MLYIIIASVSAILGYSLACLMSSKSEYEKRIEDEEQEKYLKEYRAKHSKDKNEF